MRSRFNLIQALSLLPQEATQGAKRPSSAVGRGYSVIIISQTLHDDRSYMPTSITNSLYANYVSYVVATRKTISIRDDQEEWIQDNYLNLSSFVQEKLDELIEEQES